MGPPAYVQPPGVAGGGNNLVPPAGNVAGIDDDDNERMATLSRFQSFTGIASQDLCMEYLAYHNFEIEPAVNEITDLQMDIHRALDKKRAIGAGNANGQANAAFPGPAAAVEQKMVELDLVPPSNNISSFKFPATDTMWCVYTEAAKMMNAEHPGKRFTLIRAYPRRVFREDAFDSTLEELGLPAKCSVRLVLGDIKH